jgi:hypothetical protein
LSIKSSSVSPFSGAAAGDPALGMNWSARWTDPVWGGLAFCTFRETLQLSFGLPSLVIPRFAALSATHNPATSAQRRL